MKETKNMARMTHRINGIARYVGCPLPCIHCHRGLPCRIIQKMIDKLAKYEDTGLQPDEIKPIEHGYWKEATIRGNPSLVCSACLSDAGTNIEYPYCSVCGAKMDLKNGGKISICSNGAIYENAKITGNGNVKVCGDADITGDIRNDREEVSLVIGIDDDNPSSMTIVHNKNQSGE